MEKNTVGEAADRKSRSEARLEAERIPINRHLPPIETEAESTRRATEDVARRAMALLIVAVKGEGLEQEIVDEIVGEYGLAEHFTPAEAAFIRDPTPSEQDRIQFTWRYESAWTLLWALGYVDALDAPDGICDVAHAVTTLKDRGASRFMAEARLRPQSEILDQADLIYRYHWAVVEARVRQQPPPEGVEPGVVYERHYALNWLIGYMDQAWDEISTDT